MTTSKECYDEAKVEYNLAERKGDQYILMLCKAMAATIATQRACAEDAQPIHGTRFAQCKAEIGEAIRLATESMEMFARAHASGDKACEGGPVQQGGGGGK